MTTPAIAPEAPISGIFECGSLATKASPPTMPHSEIEGEKAPAAERLLDVVAEHPQEDHVAEHVHESACRNR